MFDALVAGVAALGEVGMADEPDGGCRGGASVSVNNHRVALRTCSLTGLELKLEAVAQGAALQLGFRLWIRRGDGYATVYDEDVIQVRDGQEYLAITCDDHGWPLRDRLPARGGDPPASGWNLALPASLWDGLSRHLLGDGGEHAAVILADRFDGRALSGRVLIPAVDHLDYVEGSTGYRSLSPEFVRDAAVRARDERLAYLAVHNHQNSAAAGFSHIDLASHERGYPALLRVTGQPVGALVLTSQAAAGELWLPGGAREPIVEVVAPDRRLRGRAGRAAAG